MELHEMSVEKLGYSYGLILKEINMLYKQKKDFEKEFARRVQESIDHQDTGGMNP